MLQSLAADRRGSAVQRLVIFLCLLVSACTAGSGDGLDASGRPIGETPDPNDEPTLSNIQARVFTPICIQCHVGASAPQGLRLDSVNSFDDLVGVPSQEVSSLFRVSPSDPDNSYLVQKIEGTASVGGQMPLGGPPLPAEDIQLIRQWITNGAQQVATSSSGVAKVRSVQAQITISESSHVVRVAFSNELDGSTIHNSSIVVIKSSDKFFGNEDDVRVFNFTVSGSFANRHAIEIRIPVMRIGDSWYRIIISPEGSAVILDAFGQPVETYQMEVH